MNKDFDRMPGAFQLYRQMLDAQTPENRFQLTACPRCGTYIIPRKFLNKKNMDLKLLLIHLRCFVLMKDVNYIQEFLFQL